MNVNQSHYRLINQHILPRNQSGRHSSYETTWLFLVSLPHWGVTFGPVPARLHRFWRALVCQHAVPTINLMGGEAVRFLFCSYIRYIETFVTVWGKIPLNFNGYLLDVGLKFDVKFIKEVRVFILDREIRLMCPQFRFDLIEVLVFWDESFCWNSFRFHLSLYWVPFRFIESLKCNRVANFKTSVFWHFYYY